LNDPFHPVPLQETHLMPVPATATAARAAITMIAIFFMVLFLFFVVFPAFPGNGPATLLDPPRRLSRISDFQFGRLVEEDRPRPSPHSGHPEKSPSNN